MKLDNYYPMGNQVLCEVSIPDKTETGILIPAEAQKVERILRVVKVGDMCQVVQLGDRVVIGETLQKYELKFGKTQYVQVPEHALIGFVREVPELAEAVNTT